jgi:DNA-binding transcriptional regulator LsrR (DeoR family)
MPRTLTPDERARLRRVQDRLHRAEAALDAAHAAWAVEVDQLGQAAVARELGIPRQTVSERVRVQRRGPAQES